MYILEHFDARDLNEVEKSIVEESKTMELNNSIEGMYSVYDMLAEEYGPPFMARNDEVAKRATVNMMLKSEVTANEFKLFKLGVFNTFSGVLMGDKKEIDYTDTLGRLRLKIVEDK